LPRQHVFIAGVQRSGTNLLIELLEWSRLTDVYHETDPRAFVNYEMLPLDAIRALAGRSPLRYFVIKSLCEHDRIGTFMDELAPAKTIWMRRGLDDTVNSAIRSFGDFASQLHRLACDKSGAGWRGRGMSDETQQLLRQFDHPGISEASAAALMWYYRNVLFFERGLHRDPRVMLVNYRDLVTAPDKTVADIFDFLGLPDASPWINRHVKPTSVGKSPPAEIEPAVRELCESLRSRFDAVRDVQRRQATHGNDDPRAK
jgi:hypothetical protein